MDGIKSVSVAGSHRRVLAVVSAFTPYFSGTGQVALNNAIQLTRAGFKVQVLTPGYDGTEDDFVEGVPVARRRLILRSGLAGLFGRLDDLADFDVVHLHVPFLGGGDQVSRLAAKKRKTMIVTYQQDLLSPGVKGALLAAYTRLALKKIIARADAVIVPTMDYARESVVCESLLSSRRLVEIPNGVDTQRFKPGPVNEAYLGRVVESGGNTRTFLFVGALDRAHYFKGLDVLIRAIKRIEETDAHLAIVGDGDMRPHYESLVRQLALENRIAFAGRVSDDVLPDYYRATLCTVLPSINGGEVFGITLLEAMSCARPTIASSLPGVRTVVDDGVTGILVPPQDVGGLAGAMRT